MKKVVFNIMFVLAVLFCVVSMFKLDIYFMWVSIAFIWIAVLGLDKAKDE